MNRYVSTFATLVFVTIGLVHADLIMHLDASVSGSVSTDASGVVTQWTDQSGLGNHALPLEGSVYYPSTSLFGSGFEGLDFGATRNSLILFSDTASDDWLDFNGDASANTGFCVMVAFKCDGLHSDWSDIIGNSSEVSSGFGMRYYNSSDPRMQAYLGGLTIQKTNALRVEVGDTIVYAFNYNASTGYYEFWDSKNNASLTGTKSRSDFSMDQVAVTLGTTTYSGRYINGLIGEVRIFDEVLSSADFIGNRNALVAKWINVPDENPPAPDPATWASEPNATGPFTIEMTATTGSDLNDVEYLFTEMTGNPGATSSDWQSSPCYRDGQLQPLTEYRYKVTMRDTAMPANIGGESGIVSVTTPDIIPRRTEGPPNVVIIYADDLGNADISRNAPSGSLCHTPNLDRICNEGIYFTNYLTHHVCSPSRAGLLTGRHYTRVGCGVEVGGTLDNSIPNIAKDFQAAGYFTGAYGKWHNCFRPMSDNGKSVHVSLREDVIPDNDIYEDFKNIAWNEGVNAYGFDDWAGYYGGGSDYFNRYDNWSGENDWWINETFSPHVAGYTTELIRNNALDFIDDHASEPFFLYVPMEAVHTPYDILNTDLQEMCDIIDDIRPSLAWNNVKNITSRSTGRRIEDVREMRCSSGAEFDKDVLNSAYPGFGDLVYYTVIYSMDKATGAILDRLASYGLTNNTIVVFSSDNGATTSGDNTPFRGNKHSLWEGGIHVPAAIWWPGTFDATTSPYSPNENEYTHLVQYFDWYPTLMAMTGQTLNGTDLDGLNLYPALQTRTAARTEFENCYFGLDEDWATVRTERWKLHFNRVPGSQKKELYDLQNDIDESSNVQGSYPAERDTLIALIDQWFGTGIVSASYMPLELDNVDDPLPAPSGDVLEVKATQTRSISNFNNYGVYIRYAKSETRDYDNHIEAGDQFSFDIYVAEDSDKINGFYCTPGRGWTPKYDSNNGINLEGNLVAQQSFPKGQWVRQVAGMGEIGALPSEVQYINLRNASSGYYHFYIDNVVMRDKDGNIRDVVWSSDADFDVSLQYRYNNVVYDSWEGVSSVSGFPFSNITLNTVDLSTLPSDTTPPEAPTLLTAKSGVSNVALDWADNPPQTGLSGYTVYRSTSQGSSASPVAMGIQKSEYVDNAVDDGTTYYYVVTAIDASGNESDDSNQDSALPPDITDDDKIDISDLAKVAEMWLITYGLNDLSVIAENWLIHQ